LNYNHSPYRSNLNAMKFINRRREFDTLEAGYAHNEPSFVEIYGRRRPGKTVLIREF